MFYLNFENRNRKSKTLKLKTSIKIYCISVISASLNLKFQKFKILL